MLKELLILRNYKFLKTAVMLLLIFTLNIFVVKLDKVSS